MVRAGAVTSFAGNACDGLLRLELAAGGRGRVVAIEAAAHFVVGEMPTHGFVNGFGHGMRLIDGEVPRPNFGIVSEGRHEDAAVALEEVGLPHADPERPVQRYGKGSSAVAHGVGGLP